MNEGPIATYQSRIEQYNNVLEETRKKVYRLGLARLIFFIIGVFISVLLFQYSFWLTLIFLFIAIAAFGQLIFFTEKLNKKISLYQALITVNENELRAMHHEFRWNTTGIEHTDSTHPYSSDLDLFGEFSIFQFVSRATTVGGQGMLAKWLLNGADKEVILQRQSSVEELKPLIDFRHHIAAHAASAENEKSKLDHLFSWLSTEDYLLNNRSLQLSRWVIPPLTIVLIYYMTIAFGIEISWFPLIIPGYLYYKSNKAISNINDATEAIENHLSIYTQILSSIESTQFRSPRLRKLKEQLIDGHSPSKEIAKFKRSIQQLGVRRNFFGIIFNLFTLWDFHWVLALENHKTSLRPNLKIWLDIIAEIECLSSFANILYNHSEYSLPELGDQTINAEDLGHPLIGPKERISNQITLLAQSHILLVTGSNMAGKSTFLRAIGINLALANAGGPVCAKKCIFQPKQIYTSMRIADDIEEGASSFYAELKKLKAVIDAVKENANIVFLLDEILKGTNSGDRHRGSEALLKQLLRNNGVGIVATHDLELSSLEQEYSGHLENWYFDVTIKEEQLTFDYTIKRGVCDSFNASILMKKMGIEMED